MLRSAMLVMGALCLASTWGTRAQGQGATAAEMLRKAQEWIGGADAVGAVRALKLDRANQTVVVMFPDRYLIESRSPAGTSVGAFDGRTLRSQSPPQSGADSARTGALAAAVAAVGVPPSPEEVRRRGVRRVAIYAFRYLARLLPEYPMSVSVVGPQECGAAGGVCLKASPADGSPVWLAVDGVTGQPRAWITEVTDASGQRGSVQEVHTFADFRTVNGLRLPFRTTTTWRMPDGSVREAGGEALESIVVNPSVAASDFSLGGQ